MNKIDVNRLRMDRALPLQSQPKPKRRWSRWLIAAAIVAAAGAASYFYLPTPPIQTTQVVTAWPSEQFLVLNSTGYIVPRRKAAVASKGTGRVEWLGANEGDKVKEGAVVARLESSDVRATYRAAVANVAVSSAALTTAQTELADAERDHSRIEGLQKKGLTAQTNLFDSLSRMQRARAALESAQAAVEAASANEDFARIAVNYTEIRAPFDGVVISRSVNVGDIVTPMSSAAEAKGAVLTMVDMGTLEVDADVSESSLALIKVGQPAEIVLDAYPTKRFRGELVVLVPSVNRASATVTAKVRILNPDGSIMPDMSARVGFLSKPMEVSQQEAMLAVNPDAIADRDGASVVFKVTEAGRAQAVPVRPGSMLGTVRGIKGELRVGDTVILNPGSVKDGDSVTLPERS